MKAALAGIVLATALGACAQEASDGLPGKEGPADREAYIEAFKGFGESSSPGEPMSEDEKVCAAEAFVDTVGLDVLQGAVTPEEVREGFWPGDYGIEIDQDDAEALVDTLRECSPVLDRAMADVAVGMVVAIVGDDVDETCLAEDADAVRTVGAIFLADNDEELLNEETGQLIYGWLAGCADMHQLTIAMLTELGMPETGAACIDQRLDDETMQQFWISAFSNPDDLATSAIVEEFLAMVEPCAGAIETTES